MEKKTPQHVEIDNETYKKSLTLNEILVYTMLKTHMDKDTLEAYPKQSTLQKETELSIPTIKKCLENLEKKNEIKIIRNGKLHKYRFNEHSEHYEMYSFEFLKEIKLKKDLKAFIIMMQPYMFKDSIKGFGKVEYSTSQLSEITGVSEDTIYRKNKELIQLGICKQFQTKDIEGNEKQALLYCLQSIGQGFVTMRNQIEENTQDIAQIKDELKQEKINNAKINKANAEIISSMWNELNKLKEQINQK